MALKIEHVPMVHIDILESETRISAKDISLGIPFDAEVFFLDTSIDELNSLEKELSIVREHINENSMLYDPSWIPHYENHIKLVNILRDEHGIRNGIYVRRS